MDTQTIQLKYFGYARKSSEDNKERQAASLPDQLFVIEGMKSKQHLQVVDILQESKSAHWSGREVFNVMLEKIEKKEANAILTWHANRLARNMIDGGKVIDLMDRGFLQEIRTPSRVYRGSPEDKWMLSVEFANSKKDSDDKSIVVKRGLEKKCRDGWRPGEPPFGYLPDKFTPGGERKIFTDNERLPFAKKMSEMFLDGVSVDEIQRISDREWHLKTRQRRTKGGKPLSISEIYVILNERFYAGWFEYPKGSGHWFENNEKIERIIDDETFDRIQAKLGHRSQYHLKHHEYAYQMIMQCGYCGSTVVPEQKWQCICTSCKTKFSITKENKDTCPNCKTRIENMPRPKILHYIYYRCKKKKAFDPPCREKGMEVHKLEKQIDAMLGSIEISPLFMDWAIRQIQKMNELDVQHRETVVESIKRAHDECRRKLDNLLQLKISSANHDGSLLSDERFGEENGKLEAELKTIEKQLASVDQQMIRANEDTAKAFTFATLAQIRFAAGDMKTKRDIFMGLGSHLTIKNKIVGFDSPDYILILKNMKKVEPSIAVRVAPSEESVFTTKMAALWAANSDLLRGWESHPA